MTHGVCWTANALPAEKRASYLAEEKRVGAIQARIFWLGIDQRGWAGNRRGNRKPKKYHVSDDPTLIAYKTKFVPSGEYRGKQNVSLAPIPIQESWKQGGFTADWTPPDYARMRRVWPKMLQISIDITVTAFCLRPDRIFLNDWVVPGVSLHQEMELSSEAGIPNEAVLSTATRNAALALGLEKQIGTIELGKRADLVVLSAKPLRDIHNTERIQYVFSAGRLMTPNSLHTE